RRTTLVVAHRRSTLELADRIAVLDGGRVADTGTLDELRSRSALFRTLLSAADGPQDRAGPPATAPAGGVTAHLWQRAENADTETEEGTAVRAAQSLAEAAATSGPGRGGP
ncbi:MAG TPA: hypothetical protein DD420_30680, partial [Streptomyces sp.]|nr:hypothetical protein [Streptomyces sp.]